MKNALHLLSLLTLVIFAACKKDDTQKADNELVGDWKFTALSCPDGAQQVASNGISFSQMFTLEGKDFDRTVSLKSDGTYTSSGDFTAIMTQAANGLMT